MCRCDELIASKEEELNEVQLQKKNHCQFRDSVLHLSPFLLEGERIFSLLQGVDLLRLYALMNPSSVEHVYVVCYIRQSIRRAFGRRYFIRRILRNWLQSCRMKLFV